MRMAIVEAMRARAKKEVPIGAVVVDANGTVLSRGYNRRIGKKDATWHAEIFAIQKACKKIRDFRLVGASIFVTLEPCPMCAGAIANARIDNVFFGAKSERNESAIIEKIFNSTKLNHKCHVEGGVLEYECGKIVRDFFRQRREQDD